MISREEMKATYLKRIKKGEAYVRRMRRLLEELEKEDELNKL